MTKTTLRRLPTWPLVGAGGLAVVLHAAAPPATAQTAAHAADRLHAAAVALFQQGRFSEAYGRFVEGAEAGHGPSARIALWMCEQGPDLFGKDWDCSPQQVEEWARSARVPAPWIAGRRYAVPAAAASGPRPLAASLTARMSKGDPKP